MVSKKRKQAPTPPQSNVITNYFGVVGVVKRLRTETPTQVSIDAEGSHKKEKEKGLVTKKDAPVEASVISEGSINITDEKEKSLGAKDGVPMETSVVTEGSRKKEKEKILGATEDQPHGASVVPEDSNNNEGDKKVWTKNDLPKRSGRFRIKYQDVDGLLEALNK